MTAIKKSRVSGRFVLKSFGSSVVPVGVFFATSLASSVPAYSAVPSGQMGSGSTSVVSFVARQEDVSFSSQGALAEIRRRTSLTWAHLGKLLTVSPRTLHNWVAGTPLRPDHETRLAGLLARVRQLAELPAFKARAVILEEAGIEVTTRAPAVELATSGTVEPPILVAEPGDLSTPLVRKRTSSMLRVKRG